MINKVSGAAESNGRLEQMEGASERKRATFERW